MEFLIKAKKFQYYHLVSKQNVFYFNRIATYLMKFSQKVGKISLSLTNWFWKLEERNCSCVPILFWYFKQ